jgi:hypothetical protein
MTNWMDSNRDATISALSGLETIKPMETDDNSAAEEGDGRPGAGVMRSRRTARSRKRRAAAAKKCQHHRNSRGRLGRRGRHCAQHCSGSDAGSTATATLEA